MGSVFSPYYNWAFKRRPETNPENHCAINVSLYGKGVRRWTMTERGQRGMSRDRTSFQVGPSSLRWTGEQLEFDIHEWAVPIPGRVRGKIRVTPKRLFNSIYPLDDSGRHHWGPIAPMARVDVDLDSPSLRWSGHAYLDSNEGAEPITRPFREWDWSRANMRDGSVAVLYDVRQKVGADRLLALRFKPDGQIEPFDAPPRQALPQALWRVSRTIRTPVDHPATVLQTLEDTPFYIRSVLSSGLLGERVTAMHETLYVPRLESQLVQLMLPWRMPRFG